MDVVFKIASDALGVMLLDRKISAWLKANDPKAYEQAERARIALLADSRHPEYLPR